MPKVLNGAQGGLGSNAYGINVTTYITLACAGANVNATSETVAQMINRFPGTYNALSCRISTNTLSTAATTVRSRKNTANANMSFTIPASTTGTFSDSTHTDTVVAGDLYNASFSTANSGTGTITLRGVHVNFVSDSNQVIYLGDGAGGGITYTTANSSNPSMLNQLAGAALVEADLQLKSTIATTWRSLQCYISANARSTTTTVRSRINGANGSQVISIPATTTGSFEDTTHTDNVAAGDLINPVVVLGTDSSAITFVFLGSALVTTALNENNFYSGIAPGDLRAAGVTNTYYTTVGILETLTNEVNTQAPMGFTTSITNLTVKIVGNTYSTSAVFKVRKNAGDGNNLVSVPGGSTGTFEDTTSSDSFTSTDLIDVSVNGGTLGNLRTISVGLLSSPTVTGNIYSFGQIIG